MDALTVLLAVSAGVLVLASALALYRIAAGPTALDRIVASAATWR